MSERSRGVAQLVEHWSPKPGVVSSNLAAPAIDMIKAITFDLDGVYFPDGKANFFQALGKLGVSEEEIKRVFLNNDEMHQYKIGKISDEDYWNWAANEWGLDIPSDQLIDLMVSGYNVDPKVENTVKVARRHGYKTLVCSNTFPARINGLQKRFGFLDNFDTAILSYGVGATKPAEIMFVELIKKSGAEAGEIAFADDKEINVIGAKSAGITAFLYESFDRFMNDLEILGVKI